MDKDEIRAWLSLYNITKYTIHEDLTVDVHQNAWIGGNNLILAWLSNKKLSNKNLTSLPFQFGIVQGNFSCSNNKLTSLEHCPKEVHGNFYCCGNKLTSLEHCPKVIEGNFSCDEYLKTDIRYLRHYLAKQLQAL